MVPAVLDGISGAAWSVVYVAAVVLGFHRKTYCIPLCSICCNFGWELWAVITRLLSGETYGLGWWIQFFWLFLDIGVLLTAILYGPRSRKGLPYVVPLLAALIVIDYVLLFRMGACLWVSFFINALMSALFVLRTRRGDHRGDSLIIAAGKLTGTLSASILNGLLYPNLLVLWLGGICFIFDSCYVWLLIDSFKQREGKK